MKTLLQRGAEERHGEHARKVRAKVVLPGQALTEEILVVRNVTNHGCRFPRHVQPIYAQETIRFVSTTATLLANALNNEPQFHR
jgi:hypothetical protein